MSEDMIPSGSTWNSKHLVSATSRLTSLKGFVASHTPSPPTRYNWSGGGGGTARGLGGSSEGEHEKKGWRAWAGQKIRGKKVKGDDDVGNTEVINVFPGWAARRYAQGSTSEGSFLQITCPHFFLNLLKPIKFFQDLSKSKCLYRGMRLATDHRRRSVGLKRLSFV